MQRKRRPAINIDGEARRQVPAGGAGIVKKTTFREAGAVVAAMLEEIVRKRRDAKERERTALGAGAVRG